MKDKGHTKEEKQHMENIQRMKIIGAMIDNDFVTQSEYVEKHDWTCVLCYSMRDIKIDSNSVILFSYHHFSVDYYLL